MQTPLRIAFRHMPPSPAVEARVREHVDRLERFHSRITGCHEREHRGDIKRHELPLLGTVDQIGECFGRIAADNGRYVYFHSNSVQGIAFGELSVGAVVEFEEEQGDHGPQASAVRLWRGPRRESRIAQ